MAELITGRRVPDDTQPHEYRPGDYGRYRGRWYCTVPEPYEMPGALGAHDVTEHDDGTITVSPSILITFPGLPDRWHGYLEAGVWRALDDCVVPAPPVSAGENGEQQTPVPVVQEGGDA